MPRKGYSKPGDQMKSRYRKMRVNGINVLVHRHLMEQKLGRPLHSGEWVHHLNGDRYDNRIENLDLISPKGHCQFHNLGRKHSNGTKAKQSAAHKGLKYPNRKPSTKEGNLKRSKTMKLVRSKRFWSTRKK